MAARLPDFFDVFAKGNLLGPEDTLVVFPGVALCFAASMFRKVCFGEGGNVGWVGSNEVCFVK